MSSGTGQFTRVACGVLVGIVLVMVGNLHGQKLVTPGYLFNSDPTCRELNGKFYLFTTQDPFTIQAERTNTFFKGMFAFHALSTTDFDHWTDHGSILTSRDVTWDAGSALWDGDAGIPANGQFYSYAPYRINSASEQNYGIFDIGVLTADNPLGPYKDALGGPMTIPDGHPLEGLSPWVVYDDHVPYLLWGAGDTSKNWVKMARLAPDMTHLAESPRDIVVPKEDACGRLDYFESPIIFEIGKKWYFTYVALKDDKGPGCEPGGSYIDYTVADSMFGPFNGPIHHLIYPAGDGNDSIQQGVCSYKGKLFIAYHIPYDNGQLPGMKIPAESTDATQDHHRQVAVTALTVLPDGTLQPIYPSRDQGVGTPGVSILTLDAFAPRREAIEFYARMNAWDEAGVNGEYQMMMGDGGYLQYNNVDFGDGAKSFHVELSSDNPTMRNGALEIHLDNPAGKLVGNIMVESTGGRMNYRTLTTDVKSEARGIHNLCLVARGNAAPTEQRLFNITSFGFTRNESLQNLAGKLGLTMGAGASDPEQLKDPEYAAIASSQYGALEPGNSMKMYALEPSEGQYSFSSADTVASFAQDHGLHVTASAPIWDGKATDYGTGNPQWLMQGHYSATQLQSILENYIGTIMQHDHNKYPGVVNRWTIVSEATHLCGVFCQGLGKDASGFPAYIALAYRYARKADPTVQLCYDDWGGEGSGSTSDAVYHLVSYLKSQGLIDCVGLEGQWEGEALGHLPRTVDIVANINRLGALGLDVYFSQVEIGLHTSNRTTANNPSDLTTQAKEYATLLQACLSTHACTGFFTWGITDRYAFCWKPGYCVPLLFDTTYNPKPAFYALQTVLSHVVPGRTQGVVVH